MLKHHLHQLCHFGNRFLISYIWKSNKKKVNPKFEFPNSPQASDEEAHLRSLKLVVGCGVFEIYISSYKT
jgi:hypothetical protein